MQRLDGDRSENSYRPCRDDRVEIIKFVVCCRVVLVKVGIDGVFQDTERVVRSLVEVDPHFLKDIVCDVVERMVCQHSCKIKPSHQPPIRSSSSHFHAFLCFASQHEALSTSQRSQGYASREQ